MQQACPTKETLSNVHQKKLRSFKGKMLKMSQVTSIREQWSEGKTISEIARAVSVDRNTVYKYTQMTDFSKAVALYVPRGCMLDKHRDEIIAMLKEERKWFHKQRYTAKRILEILKERHACRDTRSSSSLSPSLATILKST